MKRRGVEMRIITEGKEEMRRKVDPALLKAIARSKRWFEELATGRILSLIAIARREHLAKRHVARPTKLAFIAPSIVEAISEGRAPAGLNLQMLMDTRVTLPPLWKDQELLMDLQIEWISGEKCSNHLSADERQSEQIKIVEMCCVCSQSK